jgi:phenylacetate-CoA ligase
MINKRQVLELYKDSTDFYRVKLKKVNFFHDIPLTTKDDLIRSQIEFPPFGNFTDYSKKVFQIYRTSGTTSRPLLLSFTKKDIDYITTIGANCLKHSGMGNLGNNEVVFNCLNLSMWAGGFLDAQAMLKTKVQVINFGTGNTNELVKLIQEFSGLYKVSLHCTPSYLPVIEKKIGNELNIGPKELKIYALYLGAEGGVQNTEFRDSLINKWGSLVFNANYGMSEVCSIIASANSNNILKMSDLFLDNYILEFLDNNENVIDQSDIEEGDSGILVFTSLKKQSQPILRYNTKERVKIIWKRNSEIYFEIIGRSDDMIIYKGINFYPEQLRDIIMRYKQFTGIYKLEVKQRNGITEEINLICEVAKNEKLNNIELLNNLSMTIRHELTLSLNIRFVYNIIREGNKHKMVEFI